MFRLPGGTSDTSALNVTVLGSKPGWGIARLTQKSEGRFAGYSLLSVGLLIIKLGVRTFKLVRFKHKMHVPSLYVFPVVSVLQAYMEQPRVNELVRKYPTLLDLPNIRA